MAGLWNSEERRPCRERRRLRRPVVCSAAAAVLGLALVVSPAHASVNIDGGRSDLPGMKQDMFDRVQKNKKGGPQKSAKVPDCPKSDKMSPFYSLAFANHEMYVRLNGTDGECERLLTIGGVNYTELQNASKTCGPAGEWKKRIAEELSAVFFQGGFDWVKSENETIEVVTETGTYQIEVNEAKYEVMLECWARACECEQAKNPVARMIFLALLVVALSGFGYDAFKLALDKFSDKKPPGKVLCKKGQKIEEVKFNARHYCDMCGVAGTIYQSQDGTYDMCKNCYKKAKKKAKDELAAWLARHPEDPDNKKPKKEKKGKGDDDDEDRSEKSGAEDGEKSADGSESEKTDVKSEKSEKTSEKTSEADDE
eukprot:TRINITY_DN16573_c0_g1_i1.p1 TRINITY_DN16573_c0_g1~~TRINITY_DN16573_c0_g1_i1.p1  ORF type:complete len:395 (+),score=125.97 TRINITY_DN16573_c0_g1_i1:83-1186(+)